VSISKIQDIMSMITASAQFTDLDLFNGPWGFHKPCEERVKGENELRVVHTLEFVSSVVPQQARTAKPTLVAMEELQLQLLNAKLAA